MGSRLGGGLRTGFASSAEGLADGVLKPFKQDVAKATQSYSASLLKQKDAALNVRDAQDKLSAAIAKHGEGSIQAEKAAVRLETAQLREGVAADNVRAATERLSEAKSRLSVAEDAATQAANTSARGFRGQVSMFAAGFRSLDAGRSSFTGLSGAVGLLARSLLGLETLQPVLSSIGAFAKSGLGKISGFAVQLGSKMTTGLQGAIRATQSTLSGWGGAIGGAVSGIASHIPQPFRTAASAISTAAASAASFIVKPFQPVASVVGGYLSNVGGAAASVLGNIPAAARTVASGIASAFHDGAAKAANALRSIATVSMAGVAAGVTALIPALTSLGRSALSAYSTYEQAVGGIDTLFKGASQTVQGYAKQAYRTAGVSANDYMEQITSFSASLISSLGGDTAKAAKAGNMAMVDMSDNANKLGTDIGDIQHAYQGFAKQNYTMLDNLKLGYGGTKEEMQRLVSDANKVKKAHGEMGDLSISKFGDVVQAIHVMQTQLDITGTTSREAATTIEGSIGSMKAAWSNWLAELGKSDADIPGLTNELASSIGTALQNILPRVGAIAKSVVTAIPAMFSSLTALLPAPFQQAISAITGVVGKFGNILAPLTAGFTALGIGGLSPLLAKIPLVRGVLGKLTGPLQMLGGPIGMLTAAIAALIATSPELQDMFGAQLSNVFASLQQAFTQLQPTFELLANTISGALTRLMPVVTNTIEQLIPVVAAVISALAPLIPQILDPLMTAIQPLVPPLTNIITALLPPLTSLIIALLPSVTQILGVIVQVASVIMSVLVPVIQQLTPIIASVIQIVAGLIVSPMPAITQIVSTVVSMITTLTPLIQGIVTVVAWVAGQIAGFISGVVLPTIMGMLPVVQSVIGTIAAVLQNIAGIVRGVVNIIAGIFTGDWPRVWNGITGVVSNAINGIGRLLSGMVDVGKNLVTGLWNGISSMGSWLWDKIGGWAGGVVDKVKGLFGIHSPSRVFRDQIGVMLAKGMAVGITDTMPVVSQAVQALTDVVPDNMNVGVAANQAAAGNPTQIGQGQGKTVIVDTKIDARGTDPDTVLNMWSARSKAAADRW
jgi:phage-related protein